MGLPHIKNSKAGINREEPIFGNLFEVYFTVPKGIQDKIGAEDVNVLTEQIKSIGGLDTLTKAPGTETQTYQGATRTYLQAGLDDTSHTLTISMNLNMRDGTDNYIYKLFKEWNSLAYNMNTGERTLKVDHVADFIRVVVYNRAGDIYKDITYHDVQLTGVSGLDGFDYSDLGLKSLEVTFVSDWADDIDA